MKIVLSSVLALLSLSTFADCSLQVSGDLPYALASELRVKNYTLTFDQNANYKSYYRIGGWYPNRQNQEGTEVYFTIYKEIPNAPREVIFEVEKSKAGRVYDLSLMRERTQRTDLKAVEKVIKALSKIEPCI